MTHKISRRDFLKLFSIAVPLAFSQLYRSPAARQAATLQHLPVPQAVQPVQRPNILILVFDSLSAKQMSLYGYQRETTPNLKRLANQSSVYHAHYAAGSFTTPGTASLLTGVYPWAHRAFNLSGVAVDEFNGRNLFAAYEQLGYHRLAYTHNRLADFLLNQFRAHIDSYIPRTTFLQNDRRFLGRIFTGDRRIASLSEEMAFVRKNHSSLFLSQLDRIFDPSQIQAASHDEFPRGLPEAFRATYLLEDAMDGIHAALTSAPQPFLAYFHLLPPHEPYRTRKEFKDKFEDGLSPDPKPSHFFTQNEPDERLFRLQRSYDEFLAYADFELGRLLDLMERSGLLKNTVVVFTADHGQLFERGIHGHITPVLYEPVIHIPLLIYDPNRPYREDIHTPTSAVDMLPTLLALAGGETPNWCEGIVMPPYQTGTPDPQRKLYVMDAKQNARGKPLSTATVAVIQEQTKLVSYYGYRGFDGPAEMYDLDRDPDERQNLVSIRKDSAAEIRYDLETMLQTVNSRYTPHT